jgi:hypothetical protein
VREQPAKNTEIVAKMANTQVFLGMVFIIWFVWPQG